MCRVSKISIEFGHDWTHLAKEFSLFQGSLVARKNVVEYPPSKFDFQS